MKNNILDKIKRWVCRPLQRLVITNPSPMHWSDCAIYNAPAMEPGPCDCGAIKAEHKWLSSLCHHGCIQVSALKIRLAAHLDLLFLRR